MWAINSCSVWGVVIARVFCLFLKALHRSPLSFSLGAGGQPGDVRCRGNRDTIPYILSLCWAADKRGTEDCHSDKCVFSPSARHRDGRNCINRLSYLGETKRGGQCSPQGAFPAEGDTSPSGPSPLFLPPIPLLPLSTTRDRTAIRMDAGRPTGLTTYFYCLRRTDTTGTRQKCCGSNDDRVTGYFLVFLG
ncbi:hypothetical protein B0T24DRAFT_75162 [Lasiosphaeria ovina]|uniref:Uncharacterized protein n=1 Tax=Lasiosphaeria ovina TaxID=92902 RepID=A0AAE0NME5_9PEZI|nr:hypothetical protein B0T24DRAFT_75162 [Lasiosphaeria ovina]